MKTKLLGVIAVCVLALTGGAADADTYDVNGIFANTTFNFYPTLSDYNNHTPQTSSNGSATLSGTIDITNNVLTDMSLHTSTGVSFNYPAPNTPAFSINGQNWTLDATFNSAIRSATLHLGASNGLLTFGSLSDVGQPGFGIVEILSSNLTGTIALETPLPAALPLFATGLGALSLLGWRRKRKASA